MKLSFAQKMGYTSLANQNARNQALISIILMSVIPVLSLFYIGLVIGQDSGQITFLTKVTIFVLTATVAVSGHLIFRKYPENIIRLREYITEIANGTLPERVELSDSHGSDDIKYIEDNCNAILGEYQHRAEALEEKCRLEKKLREALEEQQLTILDAERQRVMIQSLGAACHHIGQPVTALRLRLYILLEQAHTKEESDEIEECSEAVQKISSILHDLQEVSKFRTESYVHGGDAVDDEILKVA